MARKRWSAQTEQTPDLLKSREKRKWQISFRRYVLEKSPCPAYAPYFGLDIENLRQWFELQLPSGLTWDDFGEKWQFEHIVPLVHFDFDKEEDLRLGWSFINLRVNLLEIAKGSLDLLGARRYFEGLYNGSHYSLCLAMLQKIEQIRVEAQFPIGPQSAFIAERLPYLQQLSGYASYEFELLNSGRTPTEIEKELTLLKNLKPRAL